MKFRFLEKHYPLPLITDAKRRIQNLTQETCLQHKSRTKSSDSITKNKNYNYNINFLTTFNQSQGSIRIIFYDHWQIPLNDPFFKNLTSLLEEREHGKNI